MKNGKGLSARIEGGEFIVTAEYLPKAEAGVSAIKEALPYLKEVPSAVNVADNPFGVVMSSLAASCILSQAGIEPVCQVVTRDRNRIALQSDLLGAAAMGIKNILCLSGYHQTLTDNAESANVYDIDSTQLIGMIKNMREKSELQSGGRIDGSFSITAGAVANPFMKPLELNGIRVSQKVGAGAAFIQTQAVFDIDAFKQWLDAMNAAGITRQAAVLAGVLPLESAEEAEYLNGKYTEFIIPSGVIDRLKAAGDEQAQKKAGLAVCLETIDKIRNMQGLRGIHILSGGREEVLPDIFKASGLPGNR